MTIRLSFSGRQTFKMCPRKYYFRYVTGIEVAKKELGALVIGKSFHAGLEEHRLSRNVKSALTAMTDTYLTESGLAPADALVETIKLEVYLLGYITKYHTVDSDVQYQTELQLGDGVADIGYIDAASVGADGRYHFVEDKTRAVLTRNLDVLMRTNEQLIHYCYLAAMDGIDVASVEMRETQKTRLVVKAKESLDSYRQRLIDEYVTVDSTKYKSATISFSIKHIVDYIKELRQWDDIMYRLIEQQLPLYHWPRNSYQCNGMFGECEFLPICACCPHARDSFVARQGYEPLDGGVFKRGFLKGDISDGYNTDRAAIVSNTEF